MSNTKNKNLSDLLKTVEGRVVGILTLVGALIGGYKLYQENHQLFGYTIAAVFAITVWLWLLYIWRAKGKARLYPKTGFDPRYRRWRYAALVGLVALPGLALVYVAYQWVKPDQQPKLISPGVLNCPPMTVTIGGFYPSDERQKNHGPAQEIRHSFLIELGDRIDQLDIHINDLDKTVINYKPLEWETAAMYLGQSEEGKAQMVVYGTLKQADPIEAKVYVCRANRCGNQGGLTAGAGAVQPIDLGAWEFECSGKKATAVDQQIADIALFVVGLVLYDQHEFTRASEFLGLSKTPEASFYQGLIYGELARQSEPLENLHKAIEKFQEVFRDDWDSPPNPSIKAHANVNIGNACLLLSQLEFQQADLQQAENHVGEADGYYRTALAAYEAIFKDLKIAYDKQRIQEAQIRATSNLAIAKITLARMKGPQRQDLFRQAAGDLQQALQLCQRSKNPDECMLARVTLASLLVEQSATEQDPKNNLTSATEAFEAALNAIEQDGSPRNQVEKQYKQAQIQANLAAVYSNEAFETMMQPDKAVELYRQASEVFTEDTYPLRWAKNESDWGLALTKQARLQPNKEEAIKLLREAIDVRFPHALTVYHENLYPRDWALTTAYLADAKREMSKREDNHRLLSNAIELSKGAVAKLKNPPMSRYALDLARVQQILGDLCYDTSLLEGSNKTKLLDEAYEAYNAARNIWSQYEYAYDKRQAEDRLSHVQNAR